MKEVQELIIKEKLKNLPNRQYIQWLQKLNPAILKSIIKEVGIKA
tara:strand:+ start:905 stop:1039 length:135 start_codon:yes stop_codon:yes gene_type:complete